MTALGLLDKFKAAGPNKVHLAVFWPFLELLAASYTKLYNSSFREGNADDLLGTLMVLEMCRYNYSDQKAADRLV